MSPRTTPLRPLKRKGFWYLARRVPKAYRHVETRDVVHLSTGIRIVDDPLGVAARAAIAKLDAEVFARWRGEVGAASIEQAERHEAAVVTARAMGLAYAEADAVAELPLRTLVDRVARVGNPAAQPDRVLGAALGTVAPPRIMLSALRKECEAIVATTLRRKSPRQLKRWRTTRDQAVDVFVQVLGADKAIVDLTRDDVLALRAHYQARILKEEIEVDTANKNIGYVGSMFRVIDDAKMLRLQPIFDKSSIKGAKARQRVPYPIAFIQSHLLSEGMFDGLNDEARRLIYLLIETGLRPSEACNLTADTIKLNHAVPHIQVRPDGREMKTDQSQRDIPLVGVALMAMKLHPEGFPRYRERADELSALVNKALASRGLRPNGETLYSLRHTFKDRLREARVDEELKDYFMGHKNEKPTYGFGYSLEAKAEVLKRIAYRPPRSV